VTGQRFTTLVVAASALSALAVALIVEGAQGDTVGLEISGGLVGLLALLGVVALARVVFVAEQARRRR